MEVFYRPELSVQKLLVDTDSIQETARNFAEYINHLMKSNFVFIVRLDSQMRYKETGCWQESGMCDTAKAEEAIRKWIPVLTESWNTGVRLSAEKIAMMYEALSSCGAKSTYFTLLPVCYEVKFMGFVICGRKKEDGDWTERELPILKFLLSVVAVSFANRNLYEDYTFQNWVYSTMMDRMQANVYVTDIQTDRILFMNKTMKKAFGLDKPEGEVCWKILQKEPKGRCQDCPVGKLVASGKGESVYQRWEAHNSQNGRYYDNYDSLMRWKDGSLVHFQHAVDITASKQLSFEASTDDLTGLYNRRGGKNRLEELLGQARHQNRTVTVCMYDVNSLKNVNDTYGHREGDNLLKTIAKTVAGVLEGDEFACRLSGDEFLIVFTDKTEKASAEKLSLVKERLEEVRRQDRVPYELSFCAGLLELPPDHTLSVAGILREVDERMYEKKRLYHMRLGKGQAGSDEINQWRLLKPEAFDYDQQYLYDALVESTDEYLYVCDIATNTFRYSRKLVEEFALPGEVIQNAPDIWRSIIHPADWEKFWLANQAVVDGKSGNHNVEYRARNRNGEWIKLSCRGHVAKNAAGDPRVFAGFIRNLGPWKPEWSE